MACSTNTKQTYPTLLLQQIARNTCAIANAGASDVDSVAGTAGQVLVNGGTAAATGAVTLTLDAALTGIASVTSSGALAFNAGGANSSITATPTGTGGFVVAHGDGSLTIWKTAANSTVWLSSDGTKALSAGGAVRYNAVSGMTEMAGRSGFGLILSTNGGTPALTLDASQEATFTFNATARAWIVNGNENTSTTSSTGIYGTSAGHPDGFNSLLIASRPNASRPIIFLTYNGVAQGERARISGTGNLILGTTTDSSNGRLQLATHTTAAGGIGFGTDTSLFRAAANTLQAPNIQIGSTATSGIQLYNTADQVTNYERVSMSWVSNAFELNVGYAGTGNTGRLLKLGVANSVGGNVARYMTVRNSADVFEFVGGTSSVSSTRYITVSGTNTATAGTNNTLALTPTYNQASGTAANTDLLINRTETAVGSGAQRLVSLQVGGAERFGVSNVGRVLVANQTSGPGAALGTLANAPSAGDPDFWLPITINGTTHWIPAWAA